MSEDIKFDNKVGFTMNSVKESGNFTCIIEEKNHQQALTYTLEVVHIISLNDNKTITYAIIALIIVGIMFLIFIIYRCIKIHNKKSDEIPLIDTNIERCDRDGTVHHLRGRQK